MLNIQYTEKLLERVKCAYSAAAERPLDQHTFPVGREFARSVGYPEAVLADLPESASARFAGVSNVSIFADIPPGSTVLDLGCGAGLDTLIAASKTGPTGKVIAVDFCPAMLDAARSAARELQVAHAEIQLAPAAELPLTDASVDVALFNGILNLNPDRDGLFRELARILRPGGCVFGAELVLCQPVSPEERTEANWFA